MTREVCDEQVSPQRRTSQLVSGGLALLIILLFAGIRFHLRNIPLERDEGEYAYMGQLLLQGIPPYKIAYNMKLPGTYAAYAAVMAVFGETPSGVHLGLLLVNAATMLLIYLLGARLFGRLAGVVSCAAYGALSISPGVFGFAGHATHFVVLPAIGGLLLLLKAVESRRAWLLFSSGLLLGLAFVMKQPGLAFVLFGGIYLLKCESWKITNRAAGVRIAAFASGALVPFAVTCVAMRAAGVFHNFWFWTFSYAHEYALSNSVADGYQLFLHSAKAAIVPVLFLWIIAGIGLFAIFWYPNARAHRFLLLSLVAISALAVCPGLYFRRHYFILMLPGIALLNGIAISWAAEYLRARKGRAAVVLFPALIFTVAVSYSFFAQRRFFFELDPVAACRSVYGLNPFPEAVRIADYIRQHSAESARVAVLGSEPEIYFYSHRHSATGYIYTYSLMEEQKYAPEMQRGMIQEIESVKPEFIVMVTMQTSWLVQPHSDMEIFAWAKQYIHEQYELTGVVDLLNADEYHWDQEARGYKPQSNLLVQVFRRKSRSVGSHA